MNTLYGKEFPDGEIVFYYDDLAMRRAYSWSVVNAHCSPVFNNNIVTIGLTDYKIVWI